MPRMSPTLSCHPCTRHDEQRTANGQAQTAPHPPTTRTCCGWLIRSCTPWSRPGTLDAWKLMVWIVEPWSLVSVWCERQSGDVHTHVRAWVRVVCASRGVEWCKRRCWWHTQNAAGSFGAYAYALCSTAITCVLLHRLTHSNPGCTGRCFPPRPLQTQLQMIHTSMPHPSTHT